PITNQGVLRMLGTTALNGAVTTTAGSTLRVLAMPTFSAAALTVANGFTNLGTLELADSSGNCCFTSTALAVTSGTLTNAAGATIITPAGQVGNSRVLAAELNNQGTLTVMTPLALGRPGAAHVNAGSITLSGASLSITQTGTTPSFTNTGTLTIGANLTVTFSGGAVDIST